MDNIIQEKINQIQLLQQNMQNFAMQRQQFQVQQTELESALAEIDKTAQTYRIIGSIMVLTDKEQLKKELDEKKQMLTVRINSIEKQEAKIREKAESLQKDVLAELENKNTDNSNKEKKNKRQDN